jgi:hypothetical protein
MALNFILAYFDPRQASDDVGDLGCGETRGGSAGCSACFSD